MFSFRRYLLVLLLPLLLAGCASYKKSVYLRHDQVLADIEQQGKLYEYRIMPKDELIIVVSTSDPASSVPFLRKLGQNKEMSSNTQGANNAKLLNYLVDNQGCIDYPVLGKLPVSGLSCRQCEDLIRQKLEAYLNEVPNVTVRIDNFKVSVLGEVNHPGTFTITDERINIFQALAQAGDMTLFADRDDVQLLREDSIGRRQIIHLDLTEAGIALAPEYYCSRTTLSTSSPPRPRCVPIHSATMLPSGSVC